MTAHSTQSCRFEWYSGRSTELASAYADEVGRVAEDTGSLLLDLHNLMIRNADWKSFLSGVVRAVAAGQPLSTPVRMAGVMRCKPALTACRRLAATMPLCVCARSLVSELLRLRFCRRVYACVCPCALCVCMIVLCACTNARVSARLIMKKINILWCIPARVYVPVMLAPLRARVCACVCVWLRGCVSGCACVCDACTFACMRVHTIGDQMGCTYRLSEMLSLQNSFCNF